MPTSPDDQRADDERHDWTTDEVQGLFDTPLLELVRQAGEIHVRFHDPEVVHVNQLLSIKTGRAPRTAATARSRCTTTRG